MFRTHVRFVCFVRNELDALVHAAVISPPFCMFKQLSDVGFSPSSHGFSHLSLQIMSWVKISTATTCVFPFCLCFLKYSKSDVQKH